MKFETKHISGKGRGKFLGFPTLNMEIPPSLNLADGIYAAWVRIGGKKFMGALHYGPIPVFDQKDKSLEVFLVDIKDQDIGDTTHIEVDIVERLRDIKNFPNSDDLVSQIKLDVARVRVALEVAPVE